MTSIGIRIGVVLALSASLTFTACQTPPGSKDGEARTGHSLVQGAKSSHPHVMAQRHKAKKTRTAPKRIPRAVISGDAKVVPPPINNYATLETWEFDEVDLDGGGDVESGVALYDSSTETLYVWWSDTMDLGADGDMETFEGFFWVRDTSVGVILDLQLHDEHDILAYMHTADGFSGLICCDNFGATEVMALEASYKR